LLIYRFSRDQYQRMIAEGILDANTVEFVDGLILDKGKSHSGPLISVIASSNGAVSPSPPLPVHRFTVDQYHRIIQAVILAEYEPAELLEGWVVTKMSRGPRHDAILAQTGKVVAARLPDRWHVRVQCAVTTEDSEPEPDLAVVRGRELDYLHRHPGPRDTALGIEVADSNVLLDRIKKGGLFARSGIAVYWMLNLPDAHIEVYTDPTGPAPDPCYRHRQIYRRGDHVPLVLDGQEIGLIPVSDLIPEPG
jgi:Uma2 family endonuclease